MHFPFRTLSRRILAAVAIATVLISSPAASQKKQVAQGPWGGKTAGVGSYATVNGIKLYYETSGAGYPLILLHGGLGAIEMFGPNLKELAKGRRVIAVDLQGHGRTADIDRPIRVQFMADDIAALIKHLKLERPDVMGYSLGGGVALQTAVRHPEVVRKLVVVSTPFRRNGFYADILAQQEQVNAAAAANLKETPMYQLYTSIAPRPQDFPTLLEKMGEYMKKDFDFSSEIAQIKAPVLIVAADADMMPASHVVEMFGLLGGGKRDGGWDGSGRPKSQLAILPNLTHYNIGESPMLSVVAIPFLNR